ncbi:MAG TPA: chemotaxis response regulator protein-glutamate methylesterase [Rhizomicrobium sp.]|jgi:two-component system chemotaxis response regulator CheB|nr:chemotaxis response regulator protein-glutamate methylesterase [Rhizomicrobium sp.]
MSTPSLPAPIRVMVVDDSAIVRGLITRTLKTEPRIEVTASCSNGEMAVAQAARKAPDVIILDIEMPVMDGLAALPKLLEANPQVRIIMASTLTQRNAGISLKALSLGATDYIAKPTTDRLNASEDFHRELIQKVIALGQRRKPAQSPDASPRPLEMTQPPPLRAHGNGGVMRRPRIIAIGSSTGGPQALLTLLGALPRTVDCPIVIAQHMPATFTTVLAQHIGRASGRPSAEAAHGMEIRPGHIYLAPGDFHFQLAREGTACIARLSQTAAENFCRPSVDPLFRSVAQHFGAESCAVMLTGMGSDGCGGAKAMAAAGAPVIAQDEATSVVWGMPGAVAQAGICSAILPLPRIAGHLAALFERATV